MTTIERILAILTQNGYRELSKPFSIGTLSFDFAHALIGDERALDLVVVVDLAAEPDDRRLVQRILALARALDVVRSKRPLTAVLASAQPRTEMLREIARVCRVLPVGAPGGAGAEKALRDWLSVLLPLQEPGASQEIIDWRQEVQRQLTPDAPSPRIEHWLRAPEMNAAAVERRLAADVEDAVTDALEEDEPE